MPGASRRGWIVRVGPEGKPLSLPSKISSASSAQTRRQSQRNSQANQRFRGRWLPDLGKMRKSAVRSDRRPSPDRRTGGIPGLTTVGGNVVVKFLEGGLANYSRDFN